jgi:hypothetical protein
VYPIGTLVRVVSNLVDHCSCWVPGPSKHLWHRHLRKRRHALMRFIPVYPLCKSHSSHMRTCLILPDQRRVSTCSSLICVSGVLFLQHWSNPLQLSVFNCTLNSKGTNIMFFIIHIYAVLLELQSQSKAEKPSGPLLGLIVMSH